jgi:hypothetical protein
VLVWLLLAGLAGLVTWAGIGVAADQPAPTPAPAAAGRPASSSPPTAAVTAGPTAADSVTPDPESGHWSRVLAALDRRREIAFSTDRPGLLATVYDRDSTALSHDRATMAAYRARGLRLVGVRLQIRWVHVLAEQPRRAVLVVRDQLGRVVAVDGNGWRTQLPRDLPTTHRITVVRTPNGWRIAVTR